MSGANRIVAANGGADPMRYRRPLLVVLAVTAAITAGTLVLTTREDVADYLADETEVLILYSINGPAYFGQEGELTPEQAKGDILHGYPVLGKTAVANRDQRRALVTAVEEALRDHSEPEANCFIPRHALRLVRAGDTIDMLICFQCRNYLGFRNNLPFPSRTRRISSSARVVLDEMLTNAGIPLPAGP